MSGFKCPFCGQNMSVSHDTYFSFTASFGRTSITGNAPNSHMLLQIYKCPNGDCNKETIIAQGESGYMDNQTVHIYPEAIYIHFPEYIPQAIRCDYEEACIIKDRSPKAAATLARRCLQGMIRDFWNITGKRNLYEEINSIQDKIPASQFRAIDAVRKIGNIGAHMEKDVNQIVDVEPEEAESLLRLIELLLDKWYIAKHEEDELCSSILKISEEKHSEKAQSFPSPTASSSPSSDQ